MKIARQYGISLLILNLKEAKAEDITSPST
jgi:hypothetical protein